MLLFDVAAFQQREIDKSIHDKKKSGNEIPVNAQVKCQSVKAVVLHITWGSISISVAQTRWRNPFG